LRHLELEESLDDIAMSPGEHGLHSPSAASLQIIDVDPQPLADANSLAVHLLLLFQHSLDLAQVKNKRRAVPLVASHYRAHDQIVEPILEGLEEIILLRFAYPLQDYLLRGLRRNPVK